MANTPQSRPTNLSELSLTLGDVSSAVRQGEQSVELADRSGDAFQRMVEPDDAGRCPEVCLWKEPKDERRTGMN